MDFIANILLIAGCIGSAAYCWVLAARLKRFTTLETGMGGAIAVLSAQVDEMTIALEKARGSADHSAESLDALTKRGEAVSRRLELMLASLHDLPGSQPNPQAPVAEDPPEDDRKLRFVRRRVPRDAPESVE